MFKSIFATLFGKKRSERELKQAKLYGRILKRNDAAEQSRQKECNHRKGGVISVDGSISLGTSGDQYAVIKHRYPWGDTWVRCLRCSHTWKPGKLGYEDALLFPTSNTTSTSGLFSFNDYGKYARELTEESK